MQKPRYQFMTVDPGLGGTGWAVFAEGTILPRAFGILNRPPPKLDWTDRAEWLAFCLEETIAEYPAPKVYIEYPAYFASVGGEMVAKRGDLCKLTYLVGMLAGRGCLYANSILLPVNQWKGQLPKKVVENRVKKVLGNEFNGKYPSHVYDSIGMGFYLKGKGIET